MFLSIYLTVETRSFEIYKDVLVNNERVNDIFYFRKITTKP